MGFNSGFKGLNVISLDPSYSLKIQCYHFFFFWHNSPPVGFSFAKFLDKTQRHTTVGRTSLDEWSACRRDLYLKTHNNHNSGIRTHKSQQASGRKTYRRFRLGCQWDRQIVITDCRKLIHVCWKVLNPTWLKKKLKRRHFSSDAEVIAAAETWLDGQLYDFFFFFFWVSCKI